MQIFKESSSSALPLSLLHMPVSVLVVGIIPSPLQPARIEHACYAMLPIFGGDENRCIRHILRRLLGYRWLILLLLCLMTIVMLCLLWENRLCSTRWIHRRKRLRGLQWRDILGGLMQHGYARRRGLRMTAWWCHSRWWDGKRGVPLVNDGCGIPLHVFRHWDRIVGWH
jgi:hypothetical protein